MTRTIINPVNNSSLSSSVIRNELQLLENEIDANAVPVFVENEIVSGSGTAFVLANTPVDLSVHVFGRGQRLKLGTDYTTSGVTITTTDPWGVGDIISDYRK